MERLIPTRKQSSDTSFWSPSQNEASETTSEASIQVPKSPGTQIFKDNNSDSEAESICYSYSKTTDEDIGPNWMTNKAPSNSLEFITKFNLADIQKFSYDTTDSADTNETERALSNFRLPPQTTAEDETSSNTELKNYPKLNNNKFQDDNCTTDTDERALSNFQFPPQRTDEDTAGSNTLIGQRLNSHKSNDLLKYYHEKVSNSASDTDERTLSNFCFPRQRTDEDTTSSRTPTGLRKDSDVSIKTRKSITLEDIPKSNSDIEDEDKTFKNHESFPCYTDEENNTGSKPHTGLIISSDKISISTFQDSLKLQTSDERLSNNTRLEINSDESIEKLNQSNKEIGYAADIDEEPSSDFEFFEKTTTLQINSVESKVSTKYCGSGCTSEVDDQCWSNYSLLEKDIKSKSQSMDNKSSKIGDISNTSCEPTESGHPTISEDSDSSSMNEPNDKGSEADLDTDTGFWETMESEVLSEVKLKVRRTRRHFPASKSPTSQKLDKLKRRLNSSYFGAIPKSIPQTTKQGPKRIPGSILNSLHVDELFEKGGTILRPISVPSDTEVMENQLLYFQTRVNEMNALQASMGKCSIALTQRQLDLDVLKDDLKSFKQELEQDIKTLELEDSEIKNKVRDIKRSKRTVTTKEISKERKLRELNKYKASLRQREVELENKKAECQKLSDNCREIKAELIRDSSDIMGISRDRPHDIRRGLMPVKEEQIRRYRKQRMAHDIVDAKLSEYGISNPFKQNKDLDQAKFDLDEMFNQNNTETIHIDN